MTSTPQQPDLPLTHAKLAFRYHIEVAKAEQATLDIILAEGALRDLHARKQRAEDAARELFARLSTWAA